MKVGKERRKKLKEGKGERKKKEDKRGREREKGESILHIFIPLKSPSNGVHNT